MALSVQKRLNYSFDCWQCGHVWKRKSEDTQIATSGCSKCGAWNIAFRESNEVPEELEEPELAQIDFDWERSSKVGVS